MKMHKLGRVKLAFQIVKLVTCMGIQPCSPCTHLHTVILTGNLTKTIGKVPYHSHGSVELVDMAYFGNDCHGSDVVSRKLKYENGVSWKDLCSAIKLT